MFEHCNYHTISQKMTRLQGKLKSEMGRFKNSNPFIFIRQVHHLRIAIYVQLFVNIGDMFTHRVNANK
jgi:hypothetical protein